MCNCPGSHITIQSSLRPHGSSVLIQRCFCVVCGPFRRVIHTAKVAPPRPRFFKQGAYFA